MLDKLLLLYAKRFPELPDPTKTILKRLLQFLLNTASFNIKKKQNVNPTVVKETNNN